MRKLTVLFLLLFTFMKAIAQNFPFDEYSTYKGNDLGLQYTPLTSTFRVWSPVATRMEIIFYSKGDGSNEIERHFMQQENNVWQISIRRNIIGVFYVFQATINNKLSDEVPDPYAKAVGINGKRAMVVDLKRTNPAGWESDRSPLFKNKTDAVIYELHVRDASISPSSGIKHKGKFLGLTERGTKNKAGLPTGLDHIRELGVTHVHLLPVFDFNSVDETKSSAQYNWGYDPLNYNVPEGSYSTNANDGTVRIKEFKQLIKTFHDNGLRVIMDVVYNHTALTEKSNFNQLVPGYYYRQTKDGKFSNATACGNETASERFMMRKFIIESMKYWVNEYHVDGFRIDLMGVHDIETMNQLSKELHAIRPDILLYGEGWTAGASPLPDSLRAIKANASRLDRIAVFSDDIRDGIKGSVFNHTDKGFVSGKKGMEESVKFGMVASVLHPQVDYSEVNYSKKPYAEQPWQTITYAECHDNHVLRDKIFISSPDASEKERMNMHMLALSIVLTSQGISFLHAGTEFFRTKNGVENSYNSGDSINAIDWGLKTKHSGLFSLTNFLVSLRKEHPAFRMTNAADIRKNITFIDNVPAGIVAYEIDGKSSGDSWRRILIVFHSIKSRSKFTLPAGIWNSSLRNNIPSQGKVTGRTIDLESYTCSIFYEML